MDMRLKGLSEEYADFGSHCKFRCPAPRGQISNAYSIFPTIWFLKMKKNENDIKKTTEKSTIKL